MYPPSLGEVFSQYYQSRVSSPAGTFVPFRAGCITRQLRALEMYAMSPVGMSPPAAVRHLLKRLERPLSPAGANTLLREMNHGVTQSSAAAAAARAVRLRKSDRQAGIIRPGTDHDLEDENNENNAIGGGSGSGSIYGGSSVSLPSMSSSVTPWTPEVTNQVTNEELLPNRDKPYPANLVKLRFCKSNITMLTHLDLTLDLLI